ncbi:hypothetical protein ACP70R_019780 [Stipagrostis hirtigluma subsp. patula]
MDIVISAVASELVSRFISFLSTKYSSKACLKKKNLDKLHHLLLRVHTVVEEAEGRYIPNSRMLLQLKRLTEAMFRGYDVLDTYMPLEKIGEERENPYSTYLYIDNFMFGRQVEKQQVVNILMQENPFSVPTVLPIIGGCRVGIFEWMDVIACALFTVAPLAFVHFLGAHVSFSPTTIFAFECFKCLYCGMEGVVGNICCDDRVRSYYSSILHFSGDEIQKIDNEKFKPVRTLVTIEFVSDVVDKDWLKFYSLVASMGKGSKVIIISRIEKLARFGTVSPIRINSLSQEEYRYLFKVLAFGSANPMDHPRLALAGKELATMMQGSLVMLNVYTAVLRNNLNVQFWTRVLELFRVMMHQNLAIFGEHPKALLERDGAIVDITGFSLSSLSGTSFRLELLTTGRDASKGSLPMMGFGDIIAGSMILPNKFKMVWESRLPPYTVICANCAAEKSQHPVSPRKKRPRLCMSL